MPVKVTRCPDRGRLPSPSQPHRLVGRPRSGCDPGLDFGSRRPFVRRVGPPRGGSFLRASSTRSPRCLPRELLGPTSPDDFCSLSRPADRSANPDPCRHPAGNLAAADRPRASAHPATAGGGRARMVPRRLSVAAHPGSSLRSSTVCRHLALSRTGSGPRSLSKQPRSLLPHRRANERCGRRDRVPSLTSPRRRFPVRRFGPRDDALASDRSRTAPLSPPGTPVLTDRTSLRGSVGGGWGVLPNTIQPTAASR